MKQPLRLAVRLVRLFSAIVYGSCLATGLSLREALGKTPSQAQRQQATQRFMRKVSAALPFEVKVYGQASAKPALWISNHISWSDIAFLGQLAPLSFLSKAEVSQWPVAGWLARCAGTLFIQRGAGDSHSISRDISARLVAGESLLLFPEGTSTDGQQVKRFYSRLFNAAKQAQVPIQPVALRYRRHDELDAIAPFIGDDSMGEHLLRVLQADIAQLEIHLLPLIDSHLSSNELARSTHQVITAVAVNAEKNLEQGSSSD